MSNLITPEYRRGCLRGWFLTTGAALFIVAFFLLTFHLNTPPTPKGWDMGGTAFVPASSNYAVSSEVILPGTTSTTIPKGGK
jgi:hypothetical protein